MSESTPREQFINECDDLFTFKSDLNEKQLDLLSDIKAIFGAAKYELKTHIEQQIAIGPRDCDEHLREGKITLRKAERRANAAVVHDFAGMDTSDEIPNYRRETVETTRQAQCHLVTVIFHQLMVRLACILPLGRYAAVCRTELEDARGEYLDGINAFYANPRD